MVYSTLPTVNPGDVIASSTWGNIVKANFDVSPMAVAGSAGQFWQYVSSGVGQWATAGSTFKSKSATQTVSASSTFVDVVASSGSFAFAIAASEVWHVRVVLFMTFTGTGGMKLQWTGPAAPTRVDGWTLAPTNTTDSSGSTSLLNPNLNQFNREASLGTAFSTAFVNHGAAASTQGAYEPASSPAQGTASYPLVTEWLIVNGSTAGTVILQIAQSAANGTCVAGISSFMLAEKVA